MPLVGRVMNALMGHLANVFVTPEPRDGPTTRLEIRDWNSGDLNMAEEDGGRRCIVTGGATVAFVELSDEVIQDQFVQVLVDYGFTHLDIQCGQYFEKFTEKLEKINTRGLTVTCFRFDRNLPERFAALRGGGASNALSGCVISHAASGTVLDVYDHAVPMILVANPRLMDNHQEQFANYAARNLELTVHGHLGRLHESIPKVVKLIEDKNLDDLPPYEEPPFPVPEDRRIRALDWVLLNAADPDEFGRQSAQLMDGQETDDEFQDAHEAPVNRGWMHRLADTFLG